MSFWSRVGDIAKSVIMPIGVFDMARSTFANSDDDGFIDAYKSAALDATHTTRDALGAGANSAPLQKVMAPTIWTGNQLGHALSTVYNVGYVSEANGGSQLRPLYSASDWTNSWKATQHVNFGQSLTNDIREIGSGDVTPAQGGIFGASPKARTDRAEFNDWTQSTAGRVTSGAIDIAVTWYADPTIIGGKLVKVSRAANLVHDGAHADDIAAAFKAGDLAANPVTKKAAFRGPQALFSNRTQESAGRFSHMIAKTDNMDVREIAARMKSVLGRSPASAGIVDLLGQAGQIRDLAVQRQVKADILLSAMGSSTAREGLISSAPELARAVERVSFAPEEFALFDGLSDNASNLYRSGDSITEAARRLATPGNEAEVEAFGERLDQIHRHMRDIVQSADDGASLERVGMNSLERAKGAIRNTTGQEFFYQDSASGRTIRAVHWASGQRFRGTVDTSEAFRGHGELMDHAARSKLFTPAERQALSQKWFDASGQSLRNKVVDDLWDTMFSKAAAKEGFTVEQAQEIAAKVASHRKAGSVYVAAEMEKARAAGKTRLVIEDPSSATPTSVDLSLLETHLRDNVALPDTELMQRILRHHKSAGTLSDRARGIEDGIMQGLDGYNDVWRLSVLARGGLFFRTQLDTQARAVAMMGATDVMKNAMVGLKHSFNKRLGRDDLIKVAMRAEDHLKHGDLIDAATELRRKAGLQSGDSGAELIRSAEAHETEAGSLAERWINPQRLGAKATKAKIAGQDVEIPAAYADEAGRAADWNAQLPGNAKLSDALTMLSGKVKGKFVEDSSAGFKTHMPDSIGWSAGYVRSMDSILGSHAGKKILEGLDLPSVDLVKTLRDDPKVKANWQDVKFDNPRFDDWIDRAINHVRYMVPDTGLRKKLLSGTRPTAEHVDRVFKPAGEMSNAQIVTARTPLEQSLTQAEEALANYAEAPTKTAAAVKAALTKKVDDAKAALGTLNEGLPDASTSALLDRMPIQGPEYRSMFSEGMGQNKALKVLQKFVILMSDQPDAVLGRHPLFVNRYNNHYRTLAARHIERNGVLDMNSKEAVLIGKTARHRAIQDVQQTMYDTARYTGGHHGLMKIVSPFLNAWEDAMISWSRLMYDDPKRIGALIKTWNAPEHLGLLTDEDGNVVRPGEHPRQKFFTIPMPGPIADWSGVKSLKVRKDALNSIFQGEVPILPGFGPVVAVPASQVVARAWPELGDRNGPVPKALQPLMRSLLNGDSPKYTPGAKGLVRDVAVGLIAPAYAKKLADAFDDTSPAYTNVFQDSWNSQIIEANLAHRKPDYKAIEKKAIASARNTQIIKFVALFGFGMSAEGAGVQEFYANQFRQMAMHSDEYRAKGTTVEQEFNKQFPEAANLKFSVSVNNTGIQAYLKTENRAKEFKKDIQDNGAGWFYLGEDNLAAAGKDEFSASIYNAQSSRQLRPGSKQTERERLTPSEMVDDNMKSQGWGQYQQIMTRVDLIAEDRGLSDYTQDPQLKQIRDDFVAGMRAQNKQWSQDFDNFDSGVLRRFVDDVATPALTDPRLKNRPDIKMLSQYLQLRDRATQIAKSRGYTLASTENSADLRKVLLDAGTAMSRQNPPFEQIWQRMLSREVM